MQQVFENMLEDLVANASPNSLQKLVLEVQGSADKRENARLYLDLVQRRQGTVTRIEDGLQRNDANK